MRRSLKILIIALAAAVLIAGSLTAYFLLRPNSKPLSDTKFLLNTVCTISLYDKKDKAALDGAFGVISHYEKLFSVAVAGSDIDNINRAVGTPVTVDPDTIDVIRESIGYSEESGGLFDISIGALTTLWNIEGDNPKVPPQDAIESAKKTVNYKNIVVSGNTVTLLDKNARLDLGGVAKGYIADKVRDYLKAQGVRRAIINLGGNVEVLGSKADNTPWVVGVQQPFMDRNQDVGFLYVSDKSVVTSGIYERYFVQDGTLYAHILDPRTGYPVENNLSSVTIVSTNSKQGDGLAATCFLLGIEKATALVESLDGIQAIFITKDGQTVTTKGIGDTVKFAPAVPEETRAVPAETRAVPSGSTAS